ncbi:hypothetical protein [Geoglobus sp.]
MNKCPVCGHELTIEEDSNEVTRKSKKCKACGFEAVDYAPRI